MKKTSCILLALALAIGIVAAGAFSASAAPGPAKLAVTAFPTESLVVADFDATEMELDGRWADPTGTEDATDFIQTAIDACAAKGGGTVWLPKGQYRVTRGIDVKAFVTLCGDWRSPDLVDDGDYGTLIIADVPSDTAKYPGLFRLHGNAGCLGLTVWYPNQRLNDAEGDGVLPYPYTFEYAGNRSGGEDYMMATVKNCTLLNSYRGVGVGLHNVDGDWDSAFDNIHEMFNASNIYGTVLETGLSLHDSADVDVIEFLSFGNKYWLGAGAAFHAPSQADLDAYTLAHTTGFEMSALDWVQFVGLHARSYLKGIRLIYTKRAYNDVAFAYSSFLDCAAAVSPDEIGPDPLNDAYSVLLTRCALEGSAAAIGPSANNAAIRLVDCAVTGELNGAYSENTGLSPATLEHQPFNEHKPARMALYDVSQAPYNAPRTLFDALPTLDATAAIQRALDDAGAAGGGLVYLPAGWYKIETRLRVPAGVELRGSSPIPTRDNVASSRGTVLMAYSGKDTNTPLTDPAFITLTGDGAGISGLRIFYPENTFDPPHAYPYTVRAEGCGVYVTNVCIVNGDRGLDLPDCPDHYVRRLVGLAWHGMIRVGTGAGKIEACLGNATFINRHGFNVPGWPDWGSSIFTVHLQPNEVFVSIEGAVNERLMNIFLYGGKSTVYVRAGSATVVNSGADGVGGPPYAADAGASLTVVNLMTYCPGADPNPPRVAIFNSHRRDYLYQPNFWDKLDDFLVEHIPCVWIPLRDFFVDLWTCVENAFDAFVAWICQ